MRVSSTLYFQTGLNSINAQQADLLHLYKQIGTGKRILTPSDDPLAAAKTINLAQSQSLNNRYTENRSIASNSLSTAESTLNDVTVLMQNMKTRLVEASNGTLSDADRSTLATVLQGARDSLLGMANAKDGSGQYVFSGSRGDTPPFQEKNGVVQYMGDQVQRLVQADQTRQVAASDVGLDIFARATPGSSAYITRMEPVNGQLPQGSGALGGPQVLDSGHPDFGSQFQIEFGAPNADGLIPYTVTVNNPDGSPSATYGNAPDVRLYDPSQPSLNLATKNGDAAIKVSFSGTPEAGDTFMVEPATSPEYVSSTTLEAGSTLKVNSAQITNYAIAKSGYSYELTFTADNAFDLVVKDATGNPVGSPQSFDFVPGRENTIDLGNGMQVRLAGTPKADDVVQVVPNETPTNLNIFDALDSVISALKGDASLDPTQQAQFRSAIATAMQTTDIIYDNVLTVRSSLGTRLNELEALDGNAAQRSLGYAAEMTRLEDLDWYTATTQLQLRSTALEAASLAFRRIQSLSLFNQGSN